MENKKILALMYDFYNQHTLIGQNDDILYYIEQIKKYNAKEILVVGAGTGRVAISLSKYATVTALDFDEGRLQLLKEKEPNIETICMNIFHYKTDKIFDLIIVPYSTLQFCNSKHDLDLFFKSLYNIMQEKTILIFDVSESFNFKVEKDKELLFKDYSSEVDDEVEVYYSCMRHKDYIEFIIEYKLCNKNTSVFEHEKYFYYDKDLFANMICQNHLETIKIDDGYGKEDFKHKHLYHCRKKTMNGNYLLGSRFAKDFNKNYGIITYSGTLAIEIALSSLHLKKGSKVLVLSEVCYSIVNTILKLGLTPIILFSKNRFYLTDDDIEKVLSKQEIDCILLVHQYGILNKLNLKKYQNRNIKIIEDIAQAWNIGATEYSIGKYSDIVVTSFGKTKPLSYGIGGGLFFNDPSIFNNVDYYDNDSREKESILLSYTYPLCECIDYDQLKNIANNIVLEQRKNAKMYYDLIKNLKNIKCIPYDEKHVWHRFPIWFEDSKLYGSVVKKLECTELEYQLSYEINLTDLKRNKSCISYDNQECSKYIILLRTRNVDIHKQLDILKQIMNNIVI